VVRAYWWLTTLAGGLALPGAMAGVARLPQVSLLEVIGLMAITTLLSAAFFERELYWLHEYGWFSSTTLLAALLLFALIPGARQREFRHRRRPRRWADHR
jgi:peptidoglycan/LPS O-acetylase OafA/YrhL